MVAIPRKPQVTRGNHHKIPGDKIRKDFRVARSLGYWVIRFSVSHLPSFSLALDIPNSEQLLSFNPESRDGCLEAFVSWLGHAPIIRFCQHKIEIYPFLQFIRCQDIYIYMYVYVHSLISSDAKISNLQKSSNWFVNLPRRRGQGRRGGLRGSRRALQVPSVWVFGGNRFR